MSWRVPERPWESARLGIRKSATTIIEEDSYRPLEPDSDEDEVNGTVPIDVARLDLETARRRDNSNGLPAIRRQL